MPEPAIPTALVWTGRAFTGVTLVFFASYGLISWSSLLP